MRSCLLALLLGAGGIAMVRINATGPAPVPRRTEPRAARLVDLSPDAVTPAPGEGTVAREDPAAIQVRKAEAERAVRGVVVDDAGAGVPGVRIGMLFARRRDCWGPGYLGGNEAVTDATGTFASRAPAGAEWCELLCTPPDGFVPPAERMIYPREGTWPRARIRLARAAYVEGVVVRADGTPVGGCAVRGEYDGAERFDASVQTSASGLFRLPVSRRVPSVTLVVSAIGTTKVILPFVDRPAGPARGDASLADVRRHDVVPGTWVRVVLPLAVQATVRVPGPDGLPLEPGILRIYDVSARACVRTRAVHESLVRIERLAPGPYRFEWHPGDVKLAPVAVRVTLPIAEPIVLRSSKGAILTGTVLAEDAEGFSATWSGPGNLAPMPPPLPEGLGIRTVRTVDGRFTLRGLGREPGTLYVHRDGDPRQAYLTGVRPGTESLAVRLEIGLAISGFVRDYDRSRYYRVRASRGPIRASSPVSADGSFTIVGLPPGRFRLELFEGGNPLCTRVAASRADVPAGGPPVVLRPR